MSSVSCDLLCVGGGLGGLAAATRARGLGLDVIICERSELLGGIASYGAGTVWAPANHLARAGGVEDDFGDAERYLDWYSTNTAVPLRTGLIHSIAPAVEWFREEAGVPFELLDFPDEELKGPGARRTGRQLQVELSGAALGPWQAKTRVGPHFPIGLTLPACGAQPAPSG
jgi:3-oxosteroid 1-dehydrogenase